MLRGCCGFKENNEVECIKKEIRLSHVKQTSTHL